MTLIKNRSEIVEQLSRLGDPEDWIKLHSGLCGDGIIPAQIDILIDSVNQDSNSEKKPVVFTFPHIAFFVCEIENSGLLTHDYQAVLHLPEKPKHPTSESDKRRYLDKVHEYEAKGYRVLPLLKIDNSGRVVFVGFQPLIEASGEYCSWCGVRLDDIPQNKTKKRLHYFCSDKCQSEYKIFKRSFSRLYHDWKQYAEHLSSGNTEAANSVKESSVYGHMFFDKDIDLFKLQFNINHNVSDIQRRLRSPCLNCGRSIPEESKLSAKFCSDRCRYEYHNTKRKKNEL